MSRKAICDLNIWYGIADGIVSPSSLEEYCLTATYYNFLELNSSPKTTQSFSRIVGTAKAIRQYSCEQILDNAMLHLARMLDRYFQDSRFDYNTGMRHWNEIQLLSKKELDFTPNQGALDLYRDNVEWRRRESNAVAKLENELAAGSAKQARQIWKESKDKYWKLASKGIVSQVTKMLFEYTNGLVTFERDDELKQIELFLGAFVIYYKRLEMGGMVAKPNDMYDLFNLIYVRPDMKYFTKENRWISIIEEANLGEYLLRT